jgi:hypothetical protein
MLPEKRDLAASRTAVARAQRDVNRRPDDPSAADELKRLRQDYFEAALAEHIREVTARAPALRPEQAERLASLLRPAGSA